MAVIANAVKQSVSLLEKEFKLISTNRTDCFAPLAMTAIYIFIIQPIENQLFELFYLFLYYQLIHPFI
jgi:hypothetical protein